MAYVGPQEQDDESKERIVQDPFDTGIMILSDILHFTQLGNFKNVQLSPVLNMHVTHVCINEEECDISQITDGIILTLD